MTVLAIPTFLMPVLLLVFLGWGFSIAVLNSWENFPQDWLSWAVVAPLLVLCLLLWPVYIVWAVRTRHLTSHEKLHWVGMILLGNIIGMPVFYVFMLRRYQGRDTRIYPKEEARVEKFCTRHGLCRAQLSPKQYHILVKYVRRAHSARWAVVPVALASVILLYMACWAIPQMSLTMFFDWLPMEHRVVVDGTNTIQYEHVPEPEVITGFLRTVMMSGVTSGIGGMMAFIFVAQSISQLFLIRRGLFIEFLQATSSTENVSGCKERE
jgi:hypothetical protein